MRALILSVLLFAGPAWADRVAQAGGDSLRLTDGPCPPSVLAHIPQGARGPFRRAYAVLSGSSFDACWAEYRDGKILIVFEDGDAIAAAAEVFKDEPGI